MPTEVWDFSVSGLWVLKRWLGYRMRARAEKASSDLSKIRPERWTAELTRELLCLWVLEVAAAVVSGPVFSSADFPTPSEAERKPPQVLEEGRSLRPVSS